MGVRFSDRYVKFCCLIIFVIFRMSYVKVCDELCVDLDVQKILEKNS